jgi:carboxylesterase type B
VFAPADAKNLPVFFWIHGGGHNLFSIAGLDPTEIMQQNKNGFISVIIQYRLGAFGFLGGEDVKNAGVLNAGLIDQNFALKWVQNNIAKFGGDPSRVTLAGESSGAASVLYQAMAYGGKQTANLFNNVITASPWFPEQYCYDDDVIEDRYEAFASRAGCSKASDTLACLRSQNTTTLQIASQKVSEARPFGTFAFLPVTDGSFIQDRPSHQLLARAVKGKRVLSGNMANEGIPLAPPTATTLQDFRTYLTTTFPQFSSSDKLAVEKTYSYAGDTLPSSPNSTLYATNGLSSPTAVNQSAYGTGQTQRVINVFAEYAFDCPSYWAAAAFPQGWKYQFSAPPAYHGYDLQALWSGTKTPGASFKHAFRAVWGNFIVNDSPVISVSDAKGGVDNSTVSNVNGASINWPEWNQGQKLLNLNATGGTPIPVAAGPYLKYDLYSDPGVSNVISLADAESWEGGRGHRCDFWQSVASKVPY